MNITMKPLKLFYCPNIPNHDDIEKALKIVSSEDCYVQINYTSPGGYAYNVTVCPGDSNKDILKRIPKMFGI